MGSPGAGAGANQQELGAGQQEGLLEGPEDMDAEVQEEAEERHWPSLAETRAQQALAATEARAGKAAAAKAARGRQRRRQGWPELEMFLGKYKDVLHLDMSLLCQVCNTRGGMGLKSTTLTAQQHYICCTYTDLPIVSGTHPYSY